MDPVTDPAAGPTSVIPTRVAMATDHWHSALERLEAEGLAAFRPSISIRPTRLAIPGARCGEPLTS